MTDAAAASTRAAVPALQVLLRGVVDYAGLFPPASLDMPSAAGEYAAYRAGPDAWLLGRFVLPAGRLDELEERAAASLPRDGASSWALSGLIGSDVEDDIERIERFNARHRDARSGAVLVDTVELKAHTARDVTRATELLDRRFDAYMEIPVAEDPEELVRAIAEASAKAKIRTGGVTADAFPPAAQIIRFLSRCVEYGVEYKATAGLHHPWRAEYPLTYASDAPRAPMFGFLNLLLASAALRAGAGADTAGALLGEDSPDHVRFDEHGVHWHGHTLPLHALDAARSSMASFGSCSFREPVAELRVLGLL